MKNKPTVNSERTIFNIPNPKKNKNFPRNNNTIIKNKFPNIEYLLCRLL